MKNFIILTEAINYIEENLSEPISRNDIAAHCYVSLSTLEKLFRYALSTSIKTYISKRRMTQAAKDIVCGEMTITDIALKYQYNSVEVFTRSFRRVWNINPSDFTEKWKFTGIYPKINYKYRKGEDLYMARKQVDMSEAYDYLYSKRGSYVICFDMQHMMIINDISYKAGDLAILEEAARIDAVAGDDMLVMRIGGDEFALITGLYELDAAKALLDKVLSKNGNAIKFEDREIPISLWGGITTIPEHTNFDKFFENLHKTLIDSKS